MSRTHRSHFPEGGHLDKRYGVPLPPDEAELKGLQGDIPIFKGGNLGHVEAAHEDDRRRRLEGGLGDKGVALMQAQVSFSQRSGPEAGSDTVAA